MIRPPQKGRKGPAWSLLPQPGTSCHREVKLERFRLLRRICQSTKEITMTIAKLTACQGESLINSTVNDLYARWAAGIPTDSGTWSRAISAIGTELWQRDAEDCAIECERHKNLAHYMLTEWRHSGICSVNKHLHNAYVEPTTARTISRMLAGGQELRADYPHIEPLATRGNCCAQCIITGPTTAETLEHVAFHCPAYQHLRAGEVSEAFGKENAEVFQIRRDVWSWR